MHLLYGSGHRAGSRARRIDFSRFPASLSAILVLLSPASCGVKTGQSGGVHISSISPDVASITGGTTVTIAGRGFDDGTGSATVLFGTATAEVISVNESTITVVLPSGVACGPVDVQISNGNGAAFRDGAFRYEGGSGSLTVASITPTLGDISGNTNVTIQGSGFTGGVGITLGGVPLRNITVVSDNQITASTAPTTEGGTSDLSLRNCATQASLPDAFLYTTDLNGGYVEMSVTQYPNPAQFGGTPPQDYIDPYVVMVEPNASAILNPLPGVDTCTLNYSPPSGGGDPFVFLDAGAQVHMESGSKSIDLDAQTFTVEGQTYYDYFYPQDDPTANDTSKYIPGASYDFGIDGSSALSGFAAASAFSVPPSYDVTSPALYADPPTQLTKNANMTFQWSGGTSQSTLMQVFFVGYDADAVATNEVLYCLLDDDGNHSIAGADLNQMTNTTQALVYTRRRSQQTFLSPGNGSVITSISYFQKIGYIRFQ